MRNEENFLADNIPTPKHPTYIMRHLLLLFLIWLSLPTFAENSDTISRIAIPKTYRYRLTLTDKAGSPFSLRHPEQFLSAKSLERRARMGISVDHHDLPVSPAYLEQIRHTGARIFNCSKWNNTVQVETHDSLLEQKLRELPFVTHVLKVYVSPEFMDAPSRHNRREELVADTTFCKDDYYGKAQQQVEQLHLPSLHDKGFRGGGMTIAILDGGFYNADIIEAFKQTKILGTRNFARPDSNIFEEHAHGMMVLSCIAPDMPNILVGTAPEASFYLLQSEDTWQEYRGEEDNWCAALEYADSLGVDIVTSSLGYTHFDTPEATLQYDWLDGQHELNSRSASLAASRGILLLNSAGNEGDETWKKIGFPADAHNILAVGAVDEHGVNTRFSSIGFTADHRVKPDAMARGGSAALLATDGTVSHANGTSFACPILAGAVACLYQAFPQKRPVEIIDAIHRSGSAYDKPNEVFGYGIPDMEKAYQILQDQ